MFNIGIGALASSVLESIDNVAKESLEDKKVSATAIRTRRKVNLSNSEISSEPSALNEKNLNDVITKRDEPPVGYENESNQSGNSGKSQESYVLPSSPRSSVDTINEGLEKSESSSIVASLASKIPVLQLSKTNLDQMESKSQAVGKDEEIRKILKKKNQEIESLNAECLELEEQNVSLKKEVQEAWDHYKQAQERAAFREAELMDEVKQIQKAKQQEKQQAVSQITKLGEEITNLTKQIQSYSQEREELMEKVEMVDKVVDEWRVRVEELEAELIDARNNSVHGVQVIRDELVAKDFQIEQMRQDHITILRQNQSRQSQLERENSELNRTLADYEMELQRLRAVSSNSLNFSSNGNVSMEEHTSVQKELFIALSKLDKDKERMSELERQLWSKTKELQALQLHYDDERRRYDETIKSQQTKLTDLENKLQESLQKKIVMKSVNLGGKDNESVVVIDQQSDNAPQEQELNDLRIQVQSLSQMLLKRQSTIVDLQAERSALKSRVHDLETRCSSAEQQLAYMRDLEEDDGDGFIEHEMRSNTTSMRKLKMDDGDSDLQRRSLRRRNNNAMDSAKVLSDLESLGVKPNGGVGKAVTMIDTWALLTGRFLRHYPLVRLGFVLYLLVLHLWVLFILVVHTHSLELIDNPKDQIMNN